MKNASNKAFVDHRRWKMSMTLVGVSILALVTAGCGGSISTHPKAAVNVGVIAGYTGSYVSFSDDLLNGVKVASALIDAHGGIMGRRVHLIPINDGLDPVDTVPAIQKMLATDNVQLVCGLAALDYQAGLPVLNKAHMVSMSYIGPDYGPVVMPYHWNMNPADDELGLAMAYYAHEKGVHRIAVVFDSSLGAQSIEPSVVSAARKLHLTIVAKPQVPETATSYQSVIQQVINAKPQMVLLQVEPAQAGAFFQQWQSLGAGSLPIVGTDVTIDQQWLQAVGPAEIAHVVSVEGETRTTSPFYKTFVSTWANVIKQPFSYVGSFMYDGMTLAALAMEEAHSTNPRIYRKYISDVSQPGPGKTDVYSYEQGVKLLKAGKKIKYVGITGPLTFNKYHRPTGDYGVYQGVLNGNSVSLATIPAEKLVGL